MQYNNHSALTTLPALYKIRLYRYVTAPHLSITTPQNAFMPSAVSRNVSHEFLLSRFAVLCHLEGRFFFDVDCRVALKNKTTVYEVHRVFYALWVCHPIFVTYDPKEIGVMVEKVKF